MTSRAHRSAFALIVAPLGYAHLRAPTKASWAAFKDAAFDWYSSAAFEHRGCGEINKNLRKRFGLAWTLVEHMKARYSMALAKVLFEETTSPLLALLSRRASIESLIVPIVYGKD